MEGFFEWMLESSLLVVLILGIRRIFMGKIRYAAIYALWLIVLLRFIIPVNFIPTPINIGNVFSDAILSGLAADSNGYKDEAADVLSKDDISDGAEEHASNIYSSNVLSEDGKNNVPGDISVNSRRTAVGRFIIFSSAIISAIFLLWITASNLCMTVRMKRHRIFYGKRNGVNVYIVCGIDNPCLYGFLRPAIYIPRSLFSDGKNGRIGRQLRIGSDELEQIITHEYVHYLHKDHIWAVFRVILISVYWFHPFLWAAAICSRKDAELYCDEAVVDRIGEENRLCYGEMLVRLAKDARWGDFRYSMTPMSRRGKEMEHRIRAISTRKHYSVWLMFPLVVAAALSLGVTCGTGAVKSRGSEVDRGIGIPAIPLLENNGISSVTQARYTGIPQGAAQEQTESEAIQNQPYEEEIAFDMKGYSDGCEQAFSNYINLFTEAVNTGNTDRLNLVLVYGSPVYEQQCNIALNYYNRGIREEVKSYSIVSFEILEENKVEIHSKEKIKVYYAEGTSRVVKQEYKYTCEKINGSWIITEMSDIDKFSAEET